MLLSRNAAVRLAVFSILLGAAGCIQQPLKLTKDDSPVVLSHQSIGAVLASRTRRRGRPAAVPLAVAAAAYAGYRLARRTTRSGA